jgi:hypothetical protein
MQPIHRAVVRLAGLVVLCLLGGGCGQNEGGRCQINDDCGSGLYCSNGTTGNGICTRPGTTGVVNDAAIPADASPDQAPAAAEVEPDVTEPDVAAADAVESEAGVDSGARAEPNADGGAAASEAAGTALSACARDLGLPWTGTLVSFASPTAVVALDQGGIDAGTLLSMSGLYDDPLGLGLKVRSTTAGVVVTGTDGQGRLVVQVLGRDLCTCVNGAWSEPLVPGLCVGFEALPANVRYCAEEGKLQSYCE